MNRSVQEREGLEVIQKAERDYLFVEETWQTRMPFSLAHDSEIYIFGQVTGTILQITNTFITSNKKTIINKNKVCTVGLIENFMKTQITYQ